MEDRKIPWRLCDSKGKQVGEFCATEEEAWAQGKALSQPPERAGINMTLDRLFAGHTHVVMTRKELCQELTALTQSPAPSKELEERYKELADEYYAKLLEGIHHPRGLFIHLARKLAAELGEEREAERVVLVAQYRTNQKLLASEAMVETLKRELAEAKGELLTVGDDYREACNEIERHRAKLARIESAAHADSNDLEQMRDGTKLTRAGIVEALVFLREELSEAREQLAKRDSDKAANDAECERIAAEVLKECVEEVNIEADLRAKLDEAEKIQATMEEAIAIKNKLYSDLCAQLANAEKAIAYQREVIQYAAIRNEEHKAKLLALSASYQRQKDALKNVHDATLLDTGDNSLANRALKIANEIAYAALAETPDVSILERVVSLLRDGISDDMDPELFDAWKFSVTTLLSTLQLDHQK